MVKRVTYLSIQKEITPWVGETGLDLMAYCSYVCCTKWYHSISELFGNILQMAVVYHDGSAITHYCLSDTISS